MKNQWAVLGVLALLGLGLFGWYTGGYNRAIGLDEQVKSSWAQMEIQLQRRFDLIPNIEATVKGSASYEKGVLTDLTQLRSQWAAAPTVPEKVEAANQFSSVLGRLIAVSENYPDLKANQSFQQMMVVLEGAENRISVERGRYNESVRQFNAYQRSFFGRFFCAKTGLTEPAVYYKVEEKSKQLPAVSF